LLLYFCAEAVGLRSLPLRVPSFVSVTRTDSVVSSSSASRPLHTLTDIQVSSSPAAVPAPRSLVSLSSDSTADTVDRSSGDAASPGLRF